MAVFVPVAKASNSRMPNLSDIKNRFDENLKRVENLLRIYEGNSPRTPGRQSVESTDLLRAAVVFLHASLEDLIRSLAEWRWPLADASSLDTIALATKDPENYNPNKTNFRLDQLASFRGSTVDEVITQSVSLALSRESFNDPGEIKKALRRCGITELDLKSRVEPLFNRGVGPMIARRHQIVHRMDKNSLGGYGQHLARSLSLKTVRRWQADVAELAATITDLL